MKKKYDEIGGGSPILKWTKKQGDALCVRLDQTCPDTAPHKPYVAFRYVDPMTDTTLEQIEKYLLICILIVCVILSIIL